MSRPYAPRDTIVGEEWWSGGFRTQLDDNVESLRECIPTELENDRAIDDNNRYNRWRMMRWQFDYSAGVPLDTLTSEFESILTSWIPSIGGTTLLFELPNVAAIARLLRLDDFCQHFHPGGKVDFDDTPRLAFTQWVLGDPEAWSDPSYVRVTKGKAAAIRRKIIDTASTDPSGAQELLSTFVRQYWYKMNRSAPWWGSHDRNGTPFGYVGYWAFEAAAIAKICELDDSELEGHKYYPYDLVHP